MAWQRECIKADRKARQVQKAADKRERVQAFAQRQLEARTRLEKDVERLEKDVERLGSLLQTARNGASAIWTAGSEGDPVQAWRQDLTRWGLGGFRNSDCTNDSLASDLEYCDFHYGLYCAYRNWRASQRHHHKPFIYLLDMELNLRVSLNEEWTTRNDLEWVFMRNYIPETSLPDWPAAWWLKADAPEARRASLADRAAWAPQRK